MQVSDAAPPVPLGIRSHLAHAVLQALADECGADILHIKGPAVDGSIRRSDSGLPEAPGRNVSGSRRISADADVLVRPEHVRRYLKELKRQGWRRHTALYSGGVVEHSTDWSHPEVGNADIHVRFPGIYVTPSAAFAMLWTSRDRTQIANRPCPVPSLEAQRLLLLLHAARNGGSDSPEIHPLWAGLVPCHQSAIRRLATELGAEVALAAALGNLNAFADRPEYALWRVLTQRDPDVFSIWFGAFKAQATLVGKASVILYALHPKGDRLDAEMHALPHARAWLSQHGYRLARGFDGLRRVLVSRGQQ